MSKEKIDMMTLQSKTLAIIMGDGAGTRLFPLTQKRAKPAVPLGGKISSGGHPDQQLPQ
jgi:hypothetical protein